MTRAAVGEELRKKTILSDPRCNDFGPTYGRDPLAGQHDIAASKETVQQWMIDDATNRVLARFAPHDSTEENMKLAQIYLERFGRPQAFYTDKASLFQTAAKTKRGESRETRDEKEMAPTQIGRALRELDIQWIGAHSPQAKGRVERSILTNQYLETKYLPWWDQNLTIEPRDPVDAHRALEKAHGLAEGVKRFV